MSDFTGLRGQKEGAESIVIGAAMVSRQWGGGQTGGALGA